MEKEIKPIPDFPGYAVSNYGEVYSLWQGRGRGARIGRSYRRLKTTLDNRGRENVTLSRSGKRVSQRVHCLVLQSFVGPRPPGMEACHFPDRDQTNNRLDNLRWDTKKSNERDKVFHKTSNRGERNGSAKLDRSQVIEIRKRKEAGVTYRELAEKYGVSLSAIQQICERSTWKWL